jgi:hypothetical protein
MTIFNDFVNVLAMRSCLPKQKKGPEQFPVPALNLVSLR